MTNQSLAHKFVEIPANKKSLSLRSLVYGKGINDSKYKVSYRINNKVFFCPYAERWKAMLKRCYSSKFKIERPTYIGCTVCEEWLTFSNFKRWMEKQDWEGKQLDKDIILHGNKVYSPETCMFVTLEINTMMSNKKINKHGLPAGITPNVASKYKVNCESEGRGLSLGTYNNLDMAKKAYRNFKSSHIIKIAMAQPDLILRDALLLNAELIRTGKI